MKMKYVWLFTFLLLFVSVTFVQGSRKSKKAQINEKFRNISKEMQASYDNGDLDQVINLFYKHCLKDDKVKSRLKAGKKRKEFKKVNEDIRADIYQLVVLSYIALDMPDLADIYLKKLLVLRRDEGVGDYWLPIRNIAKKYTVSPRLLLGLKAGANFTLAHPVNRFQILDPTIGSPEDIFYKDYLLSFNHSRGTQLGMIFRCILNKKMSLNIQPTFGSLRFQYKNDYKWESEEGEEVTTAEFTHNQNLSYIEIPVLFRYRLMGSIKSKLKTHIQVGGFYRIITSASKSININLTEEESQSPAEFTKKDINIKDQIARSDIGFLVGAAVGYDLGEILLEIEVNYKHSFNNIVNGDRRYENHELMYGYYDVFDDMKLRNWELSLHILLPVSFRVLKK